jgi:hypothetical protein
MWCRNGPGSGAPAAARASGLRSARRARPCDMPSAQPGSARPALANVETELSAGSRSAPIRRRAVSPDAGSRSTHQNRGAPSLSGDAPGRVSESSYVGNVHSNRSPGVDTIGSRISRAIVRNGSGARWPKIVTYGDSSDSTDSSSSTRVPGSRRTVSSASSSQPSCSACQTSGSSMHSGSDQRSRASGS